MSFIFVFGTDLDGSHITGSGPTARQEYGAKVGICEGLVMKSYALPYLDSDLELLDFDEIKIRVDDLLRYGCKKDNKQFYLTRIGFAWGEEVEKVIACMFVSAPKNFTFPVLWREYISACDAND